MYRIHSCDSTYMAYQLDDDADGGGGVDGGGGGGGGDDGDDDDECGITQVATLYFPQRWRPK